ncbi:MAG TPA: phenylacetate--CoA ligase family protein [Bacteroidetes bacterium]|nr:phenylacetate--CoA ligase family protein [Bacteroidota bacterium]
MKIQYKIFTYLKEEQWEYFYCLKRLEKESKNVILSRQREQLKNIILKAYNTTIYYKNLYDECGVSEKIISGRYEIEELPILTKLDLRDNSRNMVSTDIDSSLLRIGHTGGSTGLPVSYYFTSDIIDKMNATLHIFYTRCGWEPGEKILHFWGARQDLKKIKNIKNALSQWIKAEKIIPAYEFDEDTLAEWYQVLIKNKPVIIQGYASVLAHLAEYIKKNDYSVPPIKGIYSTAEILYPTQRKLLEEVFETRIFDQYGCREIPGIACECQYGNMHIMTEMAHVESIKINDEQTGRLIITSLSNHAMPLIRYEVGDTGYLKEGNCECGLPYPIMGMGMCRTNDIIVTKRGKHIYPSYFVHLMDEFHFIKQYQFRQVATDKIHLYIVGDIKKEQYKEILNKIRLRINEDYAGDLELELKTNIEIQKTPSGKYRYVISELTERKFV